MCNGGEVGVDVCIVAETVTPFCFAYVDVDVCAVGS